MREAYEQYKDQGFEVLSISVQEADPPVAAFVERYGLTYTQLMDRNASVFTRYGVSSTPTTFFVSPDGEIVDTRVGVVDVGWLTRNIERYLTG